MGETAPIGLSLVGLLPSLKGVAPDQRLGTRERERDYFAAICLGNACSLQF